MAKNIENRMEKDMGIMRSQWIEDAEIMEVVRGVGGIERINIENGRLE